MLKCFLANNHTPMDPMESNSWLVSCPGFPKETVKKVDPKYNILGTKYFVVTFGLCCVTPYIMSLLLHYNASAAGTLWY